MTCRPARRAAASHPPRWRRAGAARRGAIVMSDPFPLVVRRPQHISEPPAACPRPHGLPVPAAAPPQPPGWPPDGWNGDDRPLDDSDDAIRQWLDFWVGLLPLWAADRTLCGRLGGEGRAAGIV